MSIHMMNRVWRESSAKGSQLLLLLAVAELLASARDALISEGAIDE